MTHGETFKFLLEEKHITIPELAEKTKIPKTTLYSLTNRQTKKTSKDVLAKIAKELDVPFDIWDCIDELQISTLLGDIPKGTIINKEVFDVSEKTVEYLKNCLDAIGYNNKYSNEDIEKIIHEKVPVSIETAKDIYYILTEKCLISKEELELIKKIRSLSKNQRTLVNSTVNEFINARKYERSQEEKMYNDMINKSKTTT